MDANTLALCYGLPVAQVERIVKGCQENGIDPRYVLWAFTPIDGNPIRERKDHRIRGMFLALEEE